MDGTCTGEHGIGEGKRHLLEPSTATPRSTPCARSSWRSIRTNHEPRQNRVGGLQPEVRRGRRLSAPEGCLGPLSFFLRRDNATAAKPAWSSGKSAGLEREAASGVEVDHPHYGVHTALVPVFFKTVYTAGEHLTGLGHKRVFALLDLEPPSRTRQTMSFFIFLRPVRAGRRRSPSPSPSCRDPFLPDSRRGRFPEFPA